MRSVWFSACTCCLVAILGCSDPPNTRGVMPASWKAIEMVSSLNAAESALYPDFGKSHPEAHILAWKTCETDDHVGLSFTIIWIRYKDSKDTERWMVGRFFLRSDAADGMWRLAERPDAKDYKYLEVFDHAPSQREVYKFLDATKWRDEGKAGGLSLKDGGLCPENWKEHVLDQSK